VTQDVLEAIECAASLKKTRGYIKVVPVKECTRVPADPRNGLISNERMAQTRTRLKSILKSFNPNVYVEPDKDSILVGASLYSLVDETGQRKPGIWTTLSLNVPHADESASEVALSVFHKSSIGELLILFDSLDGGESTRCAIADHPHLYVSQEPDPATYSGSSPLHTIVVKCVYRSRKLVQEFHHCLPMEKQDCAKLYNLLRWMLLYGNAKKIKILRDATTNTISFTAVHKGDDMMYVHSADSQ